MTIGSNARRGAGAVAALVLLAGTVLAAEPSGSPSGSPSETASTAASTSPALSAVPSAAASTAPVASVLPSASPSPQTPAASQPSAAPKAVESPDDEDGPPSANQVARIVGRLKDAGITATAAQVTDLAGQVGTGGAVRVLAFSHASGLTTAQILAMFQAGKGWGQIDHELHLPIGPGIGWIMGNGGGHGPNGKP